MTNRVLVISAITFALLTAGCQSPNQRRAAYEAGSDAATACALGAFAFGGNIIKWAVGCALVAAGIGAANAGSGGYSQQQVVQQIRQRECDPGMVRYQFTNSSEFACFRQHQLTGNVPQADCRNGDAPGISYWIDPVTPRCMWPKYPQLNYSFRMEMLQQQEVYVAPALFTGNNCLPFSYSLNGVGPLEAVAATQALTNVAGYAARIRTRRADS